MLRRAHSTKGRPSLEWNVAGRRGVTRTRQAHSRWNLFFLISFLFYFFSLSCRIARRYSIPYRRILACTGPKATSPSELSTLKAVTVAVSQLHADISLSLSPSLYFFLCLSDTGPRLASSAESHPRSAHLLRWTQQRGEGRGESATVSPP